jgi:hypothetical protein
MSILLTANEASERLSGVKEARGTSFRREDLDSKARKF